MRVTTRRLPPAPLLVVAFVVALVLGRSCALAGDAASWMFEPAVVVQVDLVLSDEARAALATEPDEYVPATFTMSYGQRHYGPWAVSLKLKGHYGSFRPLDGKAAFKLKFPSGARPDGLKKLTLNNMVQDASKVHEALSYELFRAMGIAAPRTGYATVTVNGEPYGLYLNVETLDTVALARWYSTTQHLYEGSYGFITNPLEADDDHYEVDEGDADDRTDLVGLLATAQDLSPGWYARMAAIADLEQMTKMWATEAFVGHWDGYSAAIVNNYYLHADGNGWFTMLPWGTDQTFVVRTQLYDDAPLHVLFNGCVQDPICGALYGDALATVTQVARRLELAEHAVTIERGIRTLIATDPKLEHSRIEARRALSATVRFLRLRRSDFARWTTTRPRAPRATTAEPSAGTIALQWTKLSGRARAITGHAVEYRHADGPWTRIDAAKSATTYAITGLPAGTYDVRVRRLAGPTASISLAPIEVVVEP